MTTENEFVEEDTFASGFVSLCDWFAAWRIGALARSHAKTVVRKPLLPGVTIR